MLPIGAFIPLYRGPTTPPYPRHIDTVNTHAQVTMMAGEFADQMLKTPEMAERLGVSATTLKRWRLAGFGPPWKRLRGARGEIRYPASSATSWMQEDLNRSYAEELARRPPGEEQEQPTPAPRARYDSRLGKTVIDRGGPS